MRIAALEESTGVSRHTLRFYEQQGLLSEVSRSENRYRNYSPKAVQRVQMITQLKQLGFTLGEIREILDALRADTMDCEQGARLMATKRAWVDQRIRELQAVSEMLAAEEQRLMESARSQCRVERR
ncbi:MAG: MerR family transcriptional regulator [Marinobacter sp.]|nr:MerR family transcriptional regulator [Marinobacter sp.]